MPAPFQVMDVVARSPTPLVSGLTCDTSTDPEYVGTYLVTQVNPFGTGVGELAKRSVTWPLSDPDGVARNTT